MNNNRREQSDKTVERILTSARSVFAAKGYNGARMDEIAELASVNKATIYYQIGDKDTLYTVVIHQAIGNVARGIARAVSLADAPEEKLKAYITFIAAAVDKNPDLPPIMMRELASGGATLPRLVIEDIASVLMILAGVLEEGKEKGLFMETSPFLIHMMIMGTILFYKKGTPIKDRQSWLPETVKVYDIKLSANLGEEVASLVLKAIRR
jgi:AcrR family transcriptional regulator